jgi:hypothetical protein
MNQELKVRGGAAAVLALVFVAGTAVGLAWNRNGADASPEAVQATQDEPQGRIQPPNGWIIDRLDLSSEQKVGVDSVLDHYGARMSGLQKSYRPRYRALVDSTVQALRGLLTEEQLDRYDSLEALSERRRSRDGSRR